MSFIGMAYLKKKSINPSQEKAPNSKFSAPLAAIYIIATVMIVGLVLLSTIGSLPQNNFHPTISKGAVINVLRPDGRN